MSRRHNDEDAVLALGCFAVFVYLGLLGVGIWAIIELVSWVVTK